VKIVLDTNTVVSGLLWRGAPRQILDQARSGKITLYTSIELLAELSDVLQREKFAIRLGQADVQADDLVMGFVALVEVIRPLTIQPVVHGDPDDDMVLACALACQADYIVSGDHHLLNLGEYKEISILKGADLLTKIA
jgi:putative PIN family toxin of toxin-antitoxin system